MEYSDKYTKDEDKYNRFQNELSLASSEFTDLMHMASLFVEKNEVPFDYEHTIDHVFEVAKGMLEIIKMNRVEVR
jgi:hypothetical protein